MTGFFEPAVSKIVATALDQVDIAKKDILASFIFSFAYLLLT